MGDIARYSYFKKADQGIHCVETNIVPRQPYFERPLFWILSRNQYISTIIVTKEPILHISRQPLCLDNCYTKTTDISQPLSLWGNQYFMYHYFEFYQAILCLDKRQPIFHNNYHFETTIFLNISRQLSCPTNYCTKTTNISINHILYPIKVTNMSKQSL